MFGFTNICCLIYRAYITPAWTYTQALIPISPCVYTLLYLVLNRLPGEIKKKGTCILNQYIDESAICQVVSSKS